MCKSFYGAPAIAETVGLEWLDENGASAQPSGTPRGANSRIQNQKSKLTKDQLNSGKTKTGERKMCKNECRTPS